MPPLNFSTIQRVLDRTVNRAFPTPIPPGNHAHTWARISDAAEHHDLPALKNMIAEGMGESDRADAIRFSAVFGFLDGVRLMTPLQSPRKHGLHQALMNAVEQGHLDIVRHLVRWTDPKFNNSAVLSIAIDSRQDAVATFLLQLCDPTADNSHPLTRAVMRGNWPMVDRFLAHPHRHSRNGLINAVVSAGKSGDEHVQEMLRRVGEDVAIDAVQAILMEQAAASPSRRDAAAIQAAERLIAALPGRVIETLCAQELALVPQARAVRQAQRLEETVDRVESHVLPARKRMRM